MTGLRLLQELQGQPIPRCISSPLGRCRRTAALVCGILEIDLAEVEFDERLSEQSCGDWEGRTIPEIESCAAERFEARALNPWQVAAPNGESYAMVAERLRSWLSDIEGQNVIAVSHSHASRVLRAVYADLPQLAIDSPTDSPDDIHVLSNGRIETLHCM